MNRKKVEYLMLNPVLAFSRCNAILSRYMNVTRLGLTFDDVLLEPRKTGVNRRDASVETRLSKKARLAIPLLSAASDTVSDARFAIALGRQGGMGVLHRNCTQEEQIKMAKDVAKAGVQVGAAVGPKDVERAVALAKAGATISTHRTKTNRTFFIYS